eukprot:2418974-Prorocentrum_lima.AAC.1
MPRVDKNNEEYKTGPKAALTEAASLQWAAQQTSADVACLVAIAASVQTRNPEEAMRLLRKD